MILAIMRETYFIIEDVKVLLASNTHFNCSYESRGVDLVAHSLAKSALSLEYFEVWMEEASRCMI